MPTPTPAKPATNAHSRTAAFVALAAALGFAAHLLGPGTTASDGSAEDKTSGASEAERQAAAEGERDEEQGATEGPDAPEAADATVTAPPAGAANVRTPSVAELEAQLAEDPDQVLQRLADALPRGEREAQRLTLLEVRALVTRGEVGTARTKARGYFERWPGGPDTATLEQLTGAHPTADRAGR